MAGSEEAVADAARKVAASMRTALGLPFHVGDTELYVTASIGASLYPSDAKTPEGDLVPPADFLPVAERTGLIRPITAWVVEQACIQARRWCDLDLDLYASINVPPSYWQPASMRRVLATIADFGLPADRIMI